ncbi:MoaD/ThiS family protein [Caulobacter sp. LjRoot300]|uniref:MoaD/ThiS family protein n=1 Tax=Caulobacter sp. LjRoot300 TaxID=3342321 RepID=UPI003ECF7C71
MASVATVQVRFFGKIADRFGRMACVDIPAAGCALAWLRTQLADQVEGGAEALGERGLRAAVDHRIVGDQAWVSPGQEVAFLSMFSGG